jgi:hypothetical protein
MPCFDGGSVSDRDNVSLEPEDEEPIEINYDAPELTYLYQAIEDKAFMAAIDFLESGKPEVRDECRTWITRFEKENEKKIRWSQLPLHAAIVFQAPTKVIELLILNYPKAVRCTDDQSMLPIHLAFRKGSCDAILHALLKEFPESVNAKEGRGRYPLQLASQGPAAKKGGIISIFEENAKIKARKTLAEEKLGGMEDKLAASESANAELQNTNEALTNEKETVEDELATVKEELAALQAGPDAAASPRSIKSTRSFRTTTPGSAVATARSIDTGDKSAHVMAKPAAKKKSFFKKMFKGKKATAAVVAVNKSKPTVQETSTPVVPEEAPKAETSPAVEKVEGVTPASSSENPAEEAAAPAQVAVEAN